MKLLVLTAISTLFFSALSHAQSLTGDALIPAPAPEKICSLSIHENDISYHPRIQATARVPGVQTATFIVDYIDTVESEPWPQEAIDAFDYALSIWGSHLASSIPIRVTANWSDFGGCNLATGTVLGSAGPLFLVELNIGDQPAALYPIAMANAVLNQDVSTSNNDIVANFNKDCDNIDADFWYFGTDGNTPPGEIDFVSVVLHELGHGLGFIGSASWDNGTGSVECNGVAGNGCLNSRPYGYDLFTFDAASDGASLLDTNAYPNPSSALGDLLTGQSGTGVFYSGPDTDFANGGEGVKLYTPSTWSSGSSYSHLDEVTFDGTVNALMTPSLLISESAHQVGPIVCGLFKDFGWPVGADCEILLPVSLTNFESITNQNRVTLYWETATETNNAGFEVQQKNGVDTTWHTLSFIHGNGTTQSAHSYTYTTASLAPGDYTFRLKQIDFDGSFSYSDTQSQTIILDTPFSRSTLYPNPFNPTTSFTYSVGADQFVQVEVYDLTGRLIKELFSGQINANNSYEIRFDASSLPSGVYMIRTAGEHFQDFQKAILLK